MDRNKQKRRYFDKNVGIKKWSCIFDKKNIQLRYFDRKRRKNYRKFFSVYDKINTKVPCFDRKEKV